MGGDGAGRFVDGDEGEDIGAIIEPLRLRHPCNIPKRLLVVQLIYCFPIMAMSPFGTTFSTSRNVKLRRVSREIDTADPALHSLMSFCRAGWVRRASLATSFSFPSSSSVLSAMPWRNALAGKVRGLLARSHIPALTGKLLRE